MGFSRKIRAQNLIGIDVKPLSLQSYLGFTIQPLADFKLCFGFMIGAQMA